MCVVRALNEVVISKVCFGVVWTVMVIFCSSAQSPVTFFL